MKFLHCFCLKRNRAAYDLSSRKTSYTNSNSIIPTVTLAPLPVSSHVSVISTESDSAKIIESSSEREINRSSTLIKYDGYARTISIRPPQPSFDDDTELYATVDKTRKAKNAIKIKTDATSTIDLDHSQGLLPASTTDFSSQPIFWSSTRSSESTIASKSIPLPYQIYIDTTTNDHNDTFSRSRPSYENILKRESLQHRAPHANVEEEQTRQEPQARENQNGERKRTISSDLSERYATITDGNNTVINQ